MNHKEGFWQERRVFVTGCTGLVGSWTVSALLDQGARIVGLARDAVCTSELVRSGLNEKIDIISGSVENQPLLERALSEYEVQTVIHLAAQTNSAIAANNPLSTFETNIRGTWCLLEAARRCGYNPQVIVASSDRAYGERDEAPCSESLPLQGRQPFDVSKSCADLLAQTYHHTYRMPVCVARFGTIFGGGDLVWNHLIPGAIRSTCRGEQPVIRQDGQSTRDYIYVKDAAHAMLHLAECMARNTAVWGHAFNFSLEVPITVLDLVHHILRLMDSPLQPHLVKDVRHQRKLEFLSAAKARRSLDWKPRYGLDDALRETIAWYRSYFAVPAASKSQPLSTLAALPAA